MFNPLMMATAQTSGISPFIKPQTRFVWNRSGETTVPGYRYKLDVHLSVNAAETAAAGSPILSIPAVTHFNMGDPVSQPGSAFNNIIISGSGAEMAIGPSVIALTAAADNALVEVLEVGVVTAYVDGGTGVAYKPWTPLQGSANHNLLLPSAANQPTLIAGTLTLTEGTPNTLNTLTLYTPKCYGFLLSAYTHTTAGTIATTSIFFNGWGCVC